MEKIDQLLGSALAKKGLSGQAESAQICFYASQWTQTPFEVISFAKGVLKVSVSSPAGASELNMQEAELKRFINQKAGANKVKKIRIMNYS